MTRTSFAFAVVSLVSAVSLFGQTTADAQPSVMKRGSGCAAAQARLSAAGLPSRAVAGPSVDEARPQTFQLLLARQRNLWAQKPMKRTGECCDTYGCAVCTAQTHYCYCDNEREECQCNCALLPVGQQAVCFQQCYCEMEACLGNSC